MTHLGGLVVMQRAWRGEGGWLRRGAPPTRPLKEHETLLQAGRRVAAPVVATEDSRLLETHETFDSGKGKKKITERLF